MLRIKEFKRYDVGKLRDMIFRLEHLEDLEVRSRDICKDNVCSQYGRVCANCMFHEDNNLNGVDCNYSLGGFASLPIRIILCRLKEILSQEDLIKYKKFKIRKEKK